MFPGMGHCQKILATLAAQIGLRLSRVGEAIPWLRLTVDLDEVDEIASSSNIGSTARMPLSLDWTALSWAVRLSS